jgi:hypothetical protein
VRSIHESRSTRKQNLQPKQRHPFFSLPFSPKRMKQPDCLERRPPTLQRRKKEVVSKRGRPSCLKSSFTRGLPHLYYKTALERKRNGGAA